VRDVRDAKDYQLNDLDYRTFRFQWNSKRIIAACVLQANKARLICLTSVNELQRSRRQA
jgi:hypothetical protein